MQEQQLWGDVEEDHEPTMCHKLVGNKWMRKAGKGES